MRLFGICINSVKNNREDKKRNAVIKGLQIKLPIGERRDSGKPQAIKKGREKRVKTNCNSANRIITGVIFFKYQTMILSYYNLIIWTKNNIELCTLYRVRLSG
jgi:hypothetical protein